MSSPSDDWLQFYQMNLSAAQQGLNTNLVQAAGNNHHVSSVAEATVVTTTMLTSPSSTNITNPSTSTSHNQLNNPAAGRVSKPTRRRRASRCAPVTLLNTDATNFRAMVQQFTGVPNAPFSIGSAQTYNNVHNLNFGLSTNTHQYRHQNPTVTTPLPSIYHYQQQQQQQQHDEQQHQMFSLNNNGDASNGFFLDDDISGNENRGGTGYILR